MAYATATATSGLASPALADRKAPLHHQQAPHSVGLPMLPPPPHVTLPGRPQKASYCRRVARNDMAMATEESTAEVVTELPEIGFEVVKSIQDAWDKLEDKYAVASLAVASVIALWGTSGMITAIDKLPVVPGVLELVGIGYTGWFAYRNLVFKPDREALFGKIKSIYSDIIGSS
ncbi:protein CURVATURE THYLAKOID 1B, chloroplastic-like [Ananas comosus]|uniref:Protein CURVATURE THYLAKOID 1B, chloroplastic-like n=1 Tax=Ananas comosus TaxID=4615 RepID=A0A6P5EWK9_ANACO|nr:protein CURVATURE THYLAKOID 1B, chloroplastic-like [Ananas comosus]